MSLNARLARLERHRPAGRQVIVAPAGLGGWGEPGVYPHEPSPHCPAGGPLKIVVPGLYHDDPMAGLTPQQRSLIGPDDTVIPVKYVEDWRGEGDA